MKKDNSHISDDRYRHFPNFITHFGIPLSGKRSDTARRERSTSTEITFERIYWICMVQLDAGKSAGGQFAWRCTWRDTGRVGIFRAILGQHGDSNRYVGIERISLADFIKLIRTPRYAPVRNYGRGNAPRNLWKLEKLRILAWTLHFSGLDMLCWKKKAEILPTCASASRYDKEILQIFGGIYLSLSLSLSQKACRILLVVKAQRLVVIRDVGFSNDIRSSVKYTGEIVCSARIKPANPLLNIIATFY